MRHGFLVLLLWTAVVQQGCAAPRAVWLAGRASDQVPLPPNGTYTDFDVYPSVCAASPGAALKIHSPLPPEESLQWYDKELKSLGWRFHLDHVDHEGNQWKTYHRDFHLGDSAIRLGSESIGVEALPGENGSVIRVAMSGFYYWDLPSRATFLPFYMDEGPVTLFFAQLFWWL